MQRNGLQNNDNCNYDGYANSPYTIAVGAIGSDGVQSWYSEPCAAMLCVAPSSSLDLGITTTDLLAPNGYNPQGDCTSSFGGTSAACPMVSGVVALMLEANPNLGWKDVQAILIDSAVIVDENDTDWSYNGAGYAVNHKYGFGMVNAEQAVQLANTWKLGVFTTAINIHNESIAVNKAIPEFNSSNPNVTVVSSVFISTPFVVEHVQVFLVANHSQATDLEVVLTSPSGTKSVLAELHGLVTLVSLELTFPSNMSFAAAGAGFGPQINTSSNTLLYNGTMVFGYPSDGCSPFTNEAELSGNIVFVRRGNCTFTDKVYMAQLAGAKAVVVINNVAGGAYFMIGSNPNITIPSIMISLEDGNGLETLAESSAIAGYLTGDLGKEDVVLTYDSWGFSSLRHWGESAQGTWRLSVQDKWFNGGGNSSQGYFNSWQLKIHYSRILLPSQIIYVVILIVSGLLGILFVCLVVYFIVKRRKRTYQKL